LKRVTKFRREISTFAGLSISGSIYKRHVKGSIKTPDVLAGLQQIRRQLQRPFILIWDRSRVHRSQLVQAYLADHPDILMEYLPPYAPELNPEEYCHGTVKHRLKNLNPDDVATLRQQLDKEFAKLRKQPDGLLSFFHYAGLSLKQLW
jgi:transposase